MAVFTDAFVRTLDDKNRLQIPSQFRNAMDPERDGSAFYIVIGERENTLSMYPEKYYINKAMGMRTDEIDDDEKSDGALNFEQVFFSLSTPIKADKQGRLVLPERQLSQVDLGDEVCVAGANYRIDLWRKSDYDALIQKVAPQRRELHAFMRRGARKAVDAS
jgi:transcriptional regulator MraZ